MNIPLALIMAAGVSGLIILLTKFVLNDDNSNSTKELKNNPNVLSLSQSIEIENKRTIFYDPMEICKSKIGYLYRHTISENSGWNMTFKNRYHKLFEFEFISYEPQKGYKTINRDFFACKQQRNIKGQFFITHKRTNNFACVLNHYENVKTESVNFNEYCQIIKILDTPMKDEDIFLILSPSVMERVLELFKIFGDNLCILFMNDKIIFIITPSIFALQKISINDTIDIFMSLISLFDLEHNANSVDKEKTKSFMKKCYKK